MPKIIRTEKGLFCAATNTFTNPDKICSETVFLDTIKNKNEELFEQLYYLDEYLNKKYAGFTPLHWAAATSGSLKIFASLLNEGADINAISDDGRTPLHIAISEAKKAQRHNIFNDISYTESYKIAFHLINDEKTNLEIIDDAGFTPLHLSVYHGLAEVEAALIKAGVDVNLAGAQGIPLHMAVCEGYDITGGVCSPLHLLDLIQTGRYGILAEQLLKAGANPNAQDSNGDTPLHRAIRFNRTEQMPMLLDFNVDCSITNQNGMNPIHLAISLNNIAALSILLEYIFVRKSFSHYTNILDIPDEDGFTPLQRAAEKGNCRAIELLLDFGADIEAQLADSKRTPLHIACYYGWLEAVRLLMRKGADHEALTTNGETPEQLARNNQKMNVANAINSYARKLRLQTMATIFELKSKMETQETLIRELKTNVNQLQKTIDEKSDAENSKKRSRPSDTEDKHDNEKLSPDQKKQKTQESIPEADVSQATISPSLNGNSSSTAPSVGNNRNSFLFTEQVHDGFQSIGIVSPRMPDQARNTDTPDIVMEENTDEELASKLHDNQAAGVCK